MAQPSFRPFRSEEAKAEYEAFCRERAKAWPPETEAMTLETASGRTFLRVCGSPTDPPLVLLPGARSSSLMWTRLVASLSARYRTYALDVIGDVGFSVDGRAVLKPEDFATWLDEVFAVLFPSGRFSLMGISFGGWLAGQYALRRPQRVRKVVMLAPGGTVLRTSLGFVARALALCVPGVGGDGKPLEKTLRWVFQDAVRGDAASRALVEEAMADVRLAVRVFDLRRPPFPTVIADRAWQSFSVPCLFLVGEHEKIYSAEAAVARLKRVAPQVKAEIIPGAGHDLTMVHPDLVMNKALDFLGDGTSRETSAA